jgi:protein-S-isoprenylcysteine O-methyltransferase Ste14
MVMEPPQSDPSGLPAVADRRAPERRSHPEQRPERAFDARTAVAVGAALCGGLVLVFVFFWALGAVDVTDAVATTSVVMLLALVWLAVYLYRSRQEETDVIRRDRERRGF